MDILTAIKERRSIRRFEAGAIEPEKIDALKEALIWAPSAGNLQSRRFYFIYNGEIKGMVARAALGQRFIAAAPLVVVGCADLRIGNYYGDRGVNLYCIQDLSCSIENMMLAAHVMGLGTCWVGAFNEGEVSEVLNLPENLRPLAIVPVGYPAHSPKAPSRVSKDEAVIEVR